MIGRGLVWAAGLGGAVGLSQFPEFSQQYLQRLGGTVDELSRVVEQFDQDAADLDLTRDQALSQLAQGGDFGAARADSMADNIQRLDRLQGDLASLQGAGPFTRASLVTHMSDTDIARKTLDAYKPAVPATFEGGSFAAIGFALGSILLKLVLSFLGRIGGLFRRNRPA